VHHCLSATRRVALAATLAALTLGVAGCGTTSSTSGSDTATAESSVSSSAALTLDDGWVKAVDVGSSDMPMTAMFGTLHNSTDSEITVSGGSSPAAAEVELHEVVRTDSGGMQMQPKEGGFVIAAGADHTLQPGADHVMLMGLTESLTNGSETSVTLQTSAGEVTFTVPVRTFTGAEESYSPDSDSSSDS
jgi:copper(I)-binding protein